MGSFFAAADFAIAADSDVLGVAQSCQLVQHFDGGVWAFGVVFFEMLAGRRAFEGDDVSDVLASVLKMEPEWSALPADLPGPVRRLLKRCLEKDPKRRLRDVGEGMLQLDDGLASGSTASTIMPVALGDSGALARPPLPLWRRALPIAAAFRDVVRYLFRRLSPDGPEALAASLADLGLERHPGIP
jgi:hypothetical protein